MCLRETITAVAAAANSFFYFQQLPTLSHSRTAQLKSHCIWYTSETQPTDVGKINFHHHHHHHRRTTTNEPGENSFLKDKPDQPTHMHSQPKWTSTKAGTRTYLYHDIFKWME
jgi:hypothetical protein